MGFALAWSRDIRNFTVHVLQVNIERINEINKILVPIHTKLKVYFSRIIHVFFKMSSNARDDLPNPIKEEDDDINLVRNAKFTITLQDFPNIDRVVDFDIDIGNDEVIIGECAEKIIEDNLGNTQSEVIDNTTNNKDSALTNEINDNKVNNFTVLNKEDELSYVSSVDSSDINYSTDESDMSDEYDNDKEWNKNLDEVKVYGASQEDKYAQ